MSNRLEELMASIAEIMKIRSDRMIGKVEHRVTKGRLREILVREFLERYLPKSLAIGTGVVVSAEGEESKEMDVVIYDKFSCPLFLEEGYIDVFPSESVYAVIEVKSHLDAPALQDCIEKIRSVKSLHKVAYIEVDSAIRNTVRLYGKEYDHFPTLGFVFAYDSIDLKKVRDLLDERNDQFDLDLERRIDMICVLKKGIIANTNIQEKMTNATPDPQTKLAVVNGENSLLIFYLLMMSILAQVWMRPIKLAEYVKGLKLLADWAD